MNTHKHSPMPKRYGRGFGDGEEANDWRDTYNADQMRAYADAATAAQSERHAQELAAYALTVSNLRAQWRSMFPKPASGTWPASQWRGGIKPRQDGTQ